MKPYEKMYGQFEKMTPEKKFLYLRSKLENLQETVSKLENSILLLSEIQESHKKE